MCKYRPEKGSKHTTTPLPSSIACKRVKRLLDSRKQYLLWFVMGINTGLRPGDLLKIRVGDVRYLKIGDRHHLIESKTGKQNYFIITKEIRKTLDGYIAEAKPKDEDYLFKSRKGNGHWTLAYVHMLIRDWCKELKIPGHYGARSLRKTWGFLLRTEHGVGFEIIAKRFKHSSPRVTMRYLNLQDQEVDDALMISL